MAEKGEKIGFLTLLVLFLSIYVLVALIIDTMFVLSPEISRLLMIIDYCICFVFIIDFAIRFYRAENKLKFMAWGWIDLLSSIPTIYLARAGRVFRIIRIVRIFRAFKSIHSIVNHVFRNKAQGALTSAALITVMTVMFSSISILMVENAPESNIKSAEDAIWWSVTTITTVGYGDRYPVTTEGRIVGMILMVVGVGLFGTFTGYIASWFAKNEREPEAGSEKK